MSKYPISRQVTRAEYRGTTKSKAVPCTRRLIYIDERTEENEHWKRRAVKVPITKI